VTQDEALTILKTGANVFLTGEPGSGKTHTVNQYVAWLRARGIEPAITASTGIAATHIGGYTIHSWSGIGIKRALSEYDLDRIASEERIASRIRRTKILIVDEVSMLAPDTLAMVDAVCREVLHNAHPFGGLQVVLVGDFFQLPPIVKIERRSDEEEPAFEQGMLIEEVAPRFAYDSSAWSRANPIPCYLTEQHRQDDDEYLRLLSAIRQNTFDKEHLRHLQSRKVEPERAPVLAPKLFSHNVNVDRVNDVMLHNVSGVPREYAMTTQGAPGLVAALVKSCLSPEKLFLKVGASVMFTKNNPKEGFVNGTLGEVESFNPFSGNPIVKARDGRLIEVEPMEWTVEDQGKIRARITQVPLRLAWAITVHKSQGMSLDEAVMDLSDVFEYGQGYVALSRVRRLDGLYLLGWNQRAFQVHPEVLDKDAAFRAQSEEAEHVFGEMPAAEKNTMHERFVRACGGTVAAGMTPKKALAGKTLKIAKTPTHEVTLGLFKEGKSIAEIAEERRLTTNTIFSHIEDLFAKGRISREEIMKLVPPTLKRALPKINAAFAESEDQHLTPVFEKLNGTYSYDDLRLARMLCEGPASHS